MAWKISDTADRWESNTCPEGYKFASPVKDDEADALLQLLDEDPVWINLTDADHEGTFVAK
jgi:hypothetical protein